MKTKLKKTYIQFAKVEDQDDGTIKVWGVASSGAVDSDNETITPEAMKAALPDYMKFGAVREMHQPQAAGTALSAEVDDGTGETKFCAHVVDPTAVLKVKTNVYKGFSVGGKVTERDQMNKSIIKGIKLVEISLVDRPANPNAVITCFKVERTAEDDVEELAEMLDAGAVTAAALLQLAKASSGSTPGTGHEEVVPVPTTVEGTGSTGGAPLKGGSTPMEPDAPVAAAKGEGTGELKKGLSSVAYLASMLESIGYLCQDVAYEAGWEGDNSPIPAKLAEWLKNGAVILGEMTAEEIGEMMGRVTEMVSANEAASKAAAAATLAKAGARFSAATKAQLAKVHSACKEAAAHLDDLSYDSDEADKVTKSDTNGIAVEETIAKAIAPLNEALKKAEQENTELKAKLEDLSKKAAPGKAFLKAVSVAKGDDTLPNPLIKADESAPAEGTPERASYEMRKVLAQGGRRLIG